MNAKKKTIKTLLGLAWIIDPILLICSLNLLFDMNIKLTIWTFSAAFMLLALGSRYFSSYKTPETTTDTTIDFHQDRNLTPAQAAALDAAAARPPVKIKARDLPSRPPVKIKQLHEDRNR